MRVVHGHRAVQGDDGFVTYEGRTRDGHRFRNAEVLAVRGVQIASVEVYFGWSLPHDVPAGRHRDAPKD